jgi:hypothetical protein
MNLLQDCMINKNKRDQKMLFQIHPKMQLPENSCARLLPRVCGKNEYSAKFIVFQVATWKRGNQFTSVYSHTSFLGEIY